MLSKFKNIYFLGIGGTGMSGLAGWCIEKKYNVVRKTLKEKFTKVYDSDNFEESWTEIANELKVDVEPRLNSNQGGKAYKNVAKISNLSNEFKTWHRSYNLYVYKLYEEFCA